ncbi:adhesin aida-i [Colletotrichum sojae]|uniref:Adhesin aida-i n=1 Tax=Colletotrichum sojae TaxID=2175907 RepID=A0A8H6IZG6_9PEZI|nr:adhesin aida-i [Colletotrichum sojae]
MQIPSLLALAAALPLAFAEDGCSDSEPPVYPAANPYNNALIPFVNPPFPALTSTPSLSISVKTEWNKNKYIRSAGMDTGSTGVVIGGGLLGFSDSTNIDKSKPGNEYLSSSGRLWTGYWISADVTFYIAEKDEKGRRKQVIAHVPILAVNESSICFAFAEYGYCPEGNKTEVVSWPTTIHYIGVGFGRGSDQQPQALPDKIPFINVGQIRGEDVDDIHQGYILSQRGVQVGLTSDSVASFKKTKLQPRAGSTDNDWQMASMAIRINNSPYNTGKALFDTGINQSYIAVYENIRSTVKTNKSSLIKGGPDVLVPGSVVQVLVPDENNPIANYTVKVTGNPTASGPEAPGYVMEKPPSASSTTGPFINTGRMFYNEFDAMLDSDCGWFGLRQH